MEQSAPQKASLFDRIFVVAILATTFFLPTLFGSISIALALLIALIAIIRTIFISSARQNFIWQPTLSVLLLSFIALFALFAINAKHPGDLSFIVNFLGLAFPLFLYQFLVHANVRVSFDRIAKMCFVGCTIGLLFALAQRYGLGIDRVVAVAAGSNAVARVAATLGFLALAAIVFHKNIKSIVPVAAVICAIGIVYLSGSRGTLLTLPIMALIAGLFALPWLWQKSKWLTIASFVALVVSATAFVLWDQNDFVVRAVFTVSELAQGRMDGHSSELRFQLLVGAWNAFWQSPIIGHGWAGHWDALMQNHPTPEIFEPVRQYFSYHNDIADFAVAGGVFGLIAYELLLAAPLLNLVFDARLRQNMPAAYALVLLPVSYFLFGLTDFIFGFDLLTTLYGFSLAFVLAAARQSSSIQQRFG